MATSLAKQLAQIAASSKSSLNLKAQKAAHSKSLIWEPTVAATQSFETLYATCHDGFEELCRLDARFAVFATTIFSEQSRDEDRTQLTAAEGAELDKRIESFLRLVGGRLRLSPAIKALEWLVRRFRIHEYNTQALVTTFLPYHSLPAFATLLSILLPQKLPPEYRFLSPYIRSPQSPPRSLLVHQAAKHSAFLMLISDYVLESCRSQQHYPALISFWAGILTEAINIMVDHNRSGRRTIQEANNQTLLHQLGPIFGKALAMKKVSGAQVGAYMALIVFLPKASLPDAAVAAFMEQLVHGWTVETLRPGLACLGVMAQYRSPRQLPARVTKSMLKIDNIGDLLVDIGKSQAIDRLASGFCLALVERVARKGDARALPVLKQLLSQRTLLLRDKQSSVVLKSLLVVAYRLSNESQVEGEGEGEGDVQLRLGLGAILLHVLTLGDESSETLRQVVAEAGLDIDDVELKLNLSLRRTGEIAATTNAIMELGAGLTTHKPLKITPDSVRIDMDIVSAPSSGDLPARLSRDPNGLSEEVGRIFVSAISLQSQNQNQNQNVIATFSKIPQLRRQDAHTDFTFFAFFIHIWCGTYPAMARAAAVDMVKQRVKEKDFAGVDLQIFIPYCLVALADRSQRVRRSAADLISVIAGLYAQPAAVQKLQLRNGGTVYEKPSQEAWLTTEVTAQVLNTILLPAGEECVMHEAHVDAVLRAWLEGSKDAKDAKDANNEVEEKGTTGRKNKKGGSSHLRLQVLTFLCSQVVSTPLLAVKERLLQTLTKVRGVSKISRTQLLVPVLQWWAELPAEEAQALCAREKIDELAMDALCVAVTVPNHGAGLSWLFKIARDNVAEGRKHLVMSAFARLREMWPSMKAETKALVAHEALEVSQMTAGPTGPGIAASEAAGLLRDVELSTEILSGFLDGIQTGARMITEPPPNKRRRLSSSESSRGQAPLRETAGDNASISVALSRATFVLQLVDTSEPLRHAKLFNSLFSVLSELQHFRTAFGSELGYLQNLVLRSLLAMMPAYQHQRGDWGGGGGQEDQGLVIDSSMGHGDLLVNCIQKSSSPLVQNSALLLMARLAQVAPDLVLHSVMPIFTFMGASVVRQNDDYSAHVVSQTIREVVPPLMASLRHSREQHRAIQGASELLASFVTAYEHVPVHRRTGLFGSLAETLGPDEFLSTIVAMLVDRYEAEPSVVDFAGELLGRFGVETQLQSLAQTVELLSDVFRPRPSLSAVLLGVGEGGGGGRDEGRGMNKERKRDEGLSEGRRDVENNRDGGGGKGSKSSKEETASRQLSALPRLFNTKGLRAQLKHLGERDDMEASRVRELYSALLEDVLELAETLKDHKRLRAQCATALASLLGLLSIGEFARAAEKLLERADKAALRQKVLRAVEQRVGREAGGDQKARTALLSLLPTLVALIRETGDRRDMLSAVACVDGIAEKFGRADVEAVVAAAATIAGECLNDLDSKGSGDSGDEGHRLRVMSLLCLASLVDVVGDAAVPVVPVLAPRALGLVRRSIQQPLSDKCGELHSAAYAVIAALTQHLPYMMTAYLDDALDVSFLSAETPLGGEAEDGRRGCLRLVASQLDGSRVFAALERCWPAAAAGGFAAVAEFIDVLSLAIDRSPRSAVAKNVRQLSAVLKGLLDLRMAMTQTAHPAASVEQQESRLAATEAVANQAILKMIYKLNDAAFRPVFTDMMEWAASPKPSPTGAQAQMQIQRRIGVYGFLLVFFGSLKSIVTGYATYVADDAAAILRTADLKSATGRELWSRVLAVLAQCFEHDQDGFWQAPAHFGSVTTALTDQFLRAGEIGVGADTVAAGVMAAVVGLASAADSAAHRKELNTALLRHLRSGSASVRLAALRCQRELAERLGEEWLAALPEMLPYMGELQDDDDEAVERETQRWILAIEGVLGESLDSMLQ